MQRLLLPLLLTTSLSAYTISFDKSFETFLKPDTLTTNITIQAQKSSEKEVLQKLTSFSTFISAYKDVEKKGGNYTIYPEYRYENNRRFKNGYKGSMQYQISTKNAHDFNSFIANLHDKKKDFDVDISLSSVSWQLSPKQKEGQIDKLRLKAILWINNYAKTLSSEVSAHCKVSKISLSAPSFDYPHPVMMEAKGLAADVAPTPEQDNQKISIRPHFELECQ
jgi:uncharacterized protein YggE